ncbi:peroxiredoxin family protein [Nonomuraea sp. CA-141351]|uniref:peroxiredoxin family protein n=1 Tax=Nonomuraea sp. CA-141351 TaxID=3239996 RepID=UPI003D905F4A
MLETGSPAPDVVLEDTDGRTVRLSDYQGDNAVLVYFMRSTSCPVCNRHVQDLIRRRDELAAAGVRVLVAVPEDRQAAAEWKVRRQIPFPVLTGRRRLIYFGAAHLALLERTTASTSRPATRPVTALAR